MSTFRASQWVCGAFLSVCGVLVNGAEAQHHHHHHHHQNGGWNGYGNGYGYGYGYGGYGQTGVSGMDANGHLVDGAGHHVTPNGYHTNGAYYGGYNNGYYNNGNTGYNNGYYNQQPNYYNQQPYYQGGVNTALPQNPLPGANMPVGPVAQIKVTGPAEGSIRYRLNGTAYSITSGQVQKFNADRNWVIEFDRGTGTSARYSLTGGNDYRFSAGSQGWDLNRTAIATFAVVPAPF